MNQRNTLSFPACSQLLWVSLLLLGWAAAACHVVAVVLWRMGGRHEAALADEPAATSVAH